jgi:hypothetical protein
VALVVVYDDLNAEDLELIRRCMLACLNDTESFEEWEFSTIFGVNRDQMRAVMERWPDVDQTSTDVLCAVGNSLANLLGYPHGHNDDFDAHFGVPFADVKKLMRRGVDGWT